jgi:hypothetical protein
VSSDSDFTRLATRLREAGMMVIGIGEKKTLIPFITACDKFIYIEILGLEETNTEEFPSDETPLAKKSKKTIKKKNAPLNNIDKELIKLISDSISDLEDENGWAYLGNLGNLLLKKKPDFDSRNYNYPKLLPLIKSLNKFEFDERISGKGNIKHVYIRLKGTK